MHIEIPGNPIPQARMRLFKRGKRNLCYDPQGREKALIKTYLKDLMKEQYAGYIFPQCPRICFTFYMPIPQSMPKYKRNHANVGKLLHLHRPDVDNLVKLYLDCLNEIVISDDSKIHLGYAVKLYHENPRTIIKIEDTQEIFNIQKYDEIYSSKSYKSIHETIHPSPCLDYLPGLDVPLFLSGSGLDLSTSPSSLR